MGFEKVVVISSSVDNNIDVQGTLVVGNIIRTEMAVQVKNGKHNVHSPVVQQVRGSLGVHDQGMIIATSDFSKGALEKAERSDANPVILVKGMQLVNLLIDHEMFDEARSV